MTAAQKKTWIASLRSSMYSQTRYVLWRLNPLAGYYPKAGYCCLGVLAVCANLNLVRDSERANTIVVDGKDLGYQPLEDLVGGPEKLKRLSSMNDHGEKSFLEIADWIEQNIITTD